MLFEIYLTPERLKLCADELIVVTGRCFNTECACGLAVYDILIIRERNCGNLRYGRTFKILSAISAAFSPSCVLLTLTLASAPF